MEGNTEKKGSGTRGGGRKHRPDSAMPVSHVNGGFYLYGKSKGKTITVFKQNRVYFKMIEQ